MTRKQLEAAKEAQRIAGTPWEDGVELRCIAMMHSILIYDYIPEQVSMPFPSDNRYLKDYVKELGIERVRQLWEEQVADYRKAEVGFAGYDSEGCWYNYCKWADD